MSLRLDKVGLGRDDGSSRQKGGLDDLAPDPRVDRRDERDKGGLHAAPPGSCQIRYSQDLLNTLVRRPRTRIELVQNKLGVTRETAARYLDPLAEAGFVEKRQAGRNNYDINRTPVDLLMRVLDD